MEQTDNGERTRAEKDGEDKQRKIKVIFSTLKIWQYMNIENDSLTKI